MLDPSRTRRRFGRRHCQLCPWRQKCLPHTDREQCEPRTSLLLGAHVRLPERALFRVSCGDEFGPASGLTGMETERVAVSTTIEPAPEAVFERATCRVSNPQRESVKGGYSSRINKR
jgi:hypothetical protein